MIDRTDPEAPRHREVARLLLARNWCDGLIGDAAYVVSLVNLGCTERDAATELNLLRMARVPCADETRLNASRQWLKERT